MEEFDYNRAREEIVKASIQKNTVEIPTILNCIDFQGLNCLEVSRYGDARLAIILSGLAKHITLLVPKPEYIDIAKNTIKESNISNEKIEVLAYNIESGLSMREKSVDVAYGEWLSHSLTQDERFLREITQTSSKYFLLVMPGLEGDDAELASIKDEDEKKKRLECKEKIVNYLKDIGWKVNIKENTLKLDFKDGETARKTFYCLTFGNNLTPEQKEKVDLFLSEDKIHNFKDDFYVLWAERQ